MHEHGQLLQRLWNWGAWARSDDSGPGGYTLSGIWANWIPSKGWDPGWGDIPDNADLGPPEIDGIDAELVDCLVRQTRTMVRRVLIRRFVLREKLTWDVVDPAIRAIDDLIDQNRVVVARMRRAHA